MYARGNDVLLTAHMDTTPNVGGKKRKRVQNVLVECHKKGKGKEKWRNERERKRGERERERERREKVTQ